MIALYGVLSLLLLLLLLAGIVEQRRHLANLESIPVRILVNGSRGKSSVTRLCAGALRGGGVRVVAKTTGTAPRLIWPDATEEPVVRRYDMANITESITVVRRAVTARPVALVAECMAVSPDLQEINQSKLIRSGIGVLTNVRQDHLEEMGPTLRDIARTLARSMPRNGVCITAATSALRVIEHEARRRNCRLVHVDPQSVTDREMMDFPPFTFRENVAVALAVAAELGIPRELALMGMWEAPLDPGALTVEDYHLPDPRSGAGKVLRMANIFAANDPSSTLLNVRQLLDRRLIRPPLFTLINCRPDRVDRNCQMGALVAHLDSEKLFVMGHPTRSAIASVPGSWGGQIIDLGGAKRRVDDIVRSIVTHIPKEASVIAIGNIHGHGEQLLAHLGRLRSLG